VEEFVWNRVRGWIAVNAGAEPVKVSVYLNRREVASTWVTYTPPTGRAAEERDGWGEIWPFQIRLYDIWHYMKRTDKLSIRVDGRPLPIAGFGTFRSPKKDGVHRPVDLWDKLNSNYLFSHSGRLQLSKRNDTVWQQRVTTLYQKLRLVISEEFGLDVFIVYGTLLGAVREGTYIGHDMDFDAAFVADSVDAEGAKRLMEDVSFTLIERGFDIETRSTALHVHDPDDPKLRIDLFHLYFDTNGELCFPFGVAGTKPFRRDQWFGTKDIEFSGTTVAIPVGAEDLVETIYGAGWRQPKPGFQWARDRVKQSSSGVLSDEMLQAAYWNNFYAHHQFSTPSNFCKTLLDRPDLPDIVVDLGCGDGRDTHGFAAAGKRVVGLDRSRIGLRNAYERGDPEFADQVQFDACDFTDLEARNAALDAVFATAGADAILFYARFLLQALNEETQNALLNQIAADARPGDYFAAEFRTDADEESKKLHSKHRRRFQNGMAFGKLLVTRYNFKIVDTCEGRGLSPYYWEDPDLYRVIARREA